MNDWDWGAIAAASAVLGAILAVVRKVWLAVRRVMHRTEEFLDDWQGAPARPGIQERPGVAVRLASIESEQVRVRREVEHNGGGSLKDAVKRIEKQQVESTSNQGRDHDAIMNLTTLLGGWIGREQRARITGHEESTEMWQAVADIHKKGPE